MRAGMVVQSLNCEASFLPSLLCICLQAVLIRMAESESAPSDAASFDRPSRSSVWKYFTRQKTSAVCSLCKKSFTYRASGGTTSNLLAHLERKHPKMIKLSDVKIKAERQSGAKVQTTINQFATIQPRSTKPCSVEVQREIMRILSYWPWLDMRPIALVRDRGLAELLAFLEPNYVLPSATHVSSLIKKQFDDGKAALSTRLKDASASGIALTTDIWTSKATQAFATTTAQLNHSSTPVEERKH